jgi:hypothetical protein
MKGPDLTGGNAHGRDPLSKILVTCCELDVNRYDLI